MSRIIFALAAAALLAGTAAAPVAEAGLFSRNKPKRTEKPAWMKEPRRYAGPVMTFHSGTLQQQGRTGWTLGGLNLKLSRDCEIAGNGDGPGHLSAGRTAVVMGPRYGDTIVAWTVMVQKPAFATGPALSGDEHLVPGDSDPNCGEMIDAPM